MKWVRNKLQRFWQSDCGRFIIQKEHDRRWSLWRAGESGRASSAVKLCDYSSFAVAKLGAEDRAGQS